METTVDTPTGVAVRPVRELLERMSARNMRVHSMLVYRSDRLVLDLWQWPHEPDLKHKLHSATKSFTVAAVGFAEAEGLLSLEDRLIDHFADRLPDPGPHLREMRLRDLLTMRTGHSRGLSGATTRLRRTGWVGEFLEEPVVVPPGRDFRYSSTTSHVLSAIVQQVAGMPVDEYLRPRLFEPLGITDYSWEYDPEGVASGGNGLSLRPKDLLSFGILHLDDGRWRGRQLLPAGWVRKASGLHVRSAMAGEWNGHELVPPPPDAVAESGYGYQFWVYPEGIYNASGLFGQECMIFPDHDAVVVVTGAMGDGTYHDLPGMLRAAFVDAFESEAGDTGDSEDADVVAGFVRRATQPQPLGTDRHRAGFVAHYLMEPGEHGLRALSVEVGSDTVALTLADDTGTHRIEHGVGRWIRQRTGASVWRLHHAYQESDALILAGAQWSDGGDTVELLWHFLEGPFIDRLRLTFTADGIRVDRGTNVNSGPTALPTVRGTLVADAAAVSPS